MRAPSQSPGAHCVYLHLHMNQKFVYDDMIIKPDRKGEVPATLILMKLLHMLDNSIKIRALKMKVLLVSQSML